MYRYGNIVTKIINSISIVLMVIGLILIIIGAIQQDQEALDNGSKCLGYGVHFFIATILCIIFVVNKAEKEVEADFYRSNTPFIVSIVFGVISQNPFYVIAGIFGLIVRSKGRPEQNQEKNND